MKTYKTAAHSAEEELGKYMGPEARIYKPWQLEKHQLEPVRIEGTVDDVLLLAQANAYVRPNFNVDEQKVEVPCLMAKLNGDIDGIYLDMKTLKTEHPELIEVYQGFALMAKPPKKTPLRKRPQWFSEENGIDLELALKADIPSLEILRPAYKKNYLRAVNRVLKVIRSDDFLSEKPTGREVLETLLFNSNKIIKMYHHFDYQYMNPKLVIYDTKRPTVTTFAVLRMLMMHALGFDVFVLSESGYSSTENYLSKEICPNHYLTKRERAYSKTLKQREKAMKYFAYIVLALIGLVIMGGIVVSISM